MLSAGRSSRRPRSISFRRRPPSPWAGVAGSKYSLDLRGFAPSDTGVHFIIRNDVITDLVIQGSCSWPRWSSPPPLQRGGSPAKIVASLLIMAGIAVLVAANSRGAPRSVGRKGTHS
jgi:hypothetical protein